MELLLRIIFGFCQSQGNCIQRSQSGQGKCLFLIVWLKYISVDRNLIKLEDWNNLSSPEDIISLQHLLR